MIVTIPTIIIILSLISYISYYKNENIIKDTGYIKSIILLIGFLLYFIGLNFNWFSSYGQSALKLLFNHCGIFLIYMILINYVLTGCELGIENNDIDKLHLIRKCEVTVINDSNIRQNQNETKSNNVNMKRATVSLDVNLLMKIEKQLNNGNDILTSNSKSSLLNNNNSMNKTDIRKLNKNISYVHSLNTELIVIYLFLFFMLTILIIYHGTETSELTQQLNGKWRYKSTLDTTNKIAYFIQFALIIYLVVKVIKVWNFLYIFTFLKYIGYASIIWVSTGPLINVN